MQAVIITLDAGEMVQTRPVRRLLAKRKENL
jgi:hypothetical protein